MARSIPDRRSTREAHNDRDFTNYKPFRTAEQKLQARHLAKKQPDGSWHSPAPYMVRELNEKSQVVIVERTAKRTHEKRRKAA